MSPIYQEVRVFAPATVANLSCGYDVLGLAIDGPGDEVVLRVVDDADFKGLRIVEITGDNGILPLEVEKNTAGVAAPATPKFAQRGHAGLPSTHAGSSTPKEARVCP